jgi:M6 family metalloprotease-like protein
MKTWIPVLLTFLLLQGCGENSSSKGVVTSAPAVTQLSRPLLVVQLNYNDIEFTHTDPSVWADKIFGESEGQLNDFYLKNSKNRFKFLPVSENNGVVNDGIMSVKLNKNHPNPANNFTLLHPDFVEALAQLDDEIDFSVYDIDKNRNISSQELLIMFIVAGNEEAYGQSTLPGVFAHQYCISSPYKSNLDNVNLMACSGNGNYAVFGERHDNNKRDATIGIIAHELGHAAFGLPDLYDTTPSMEPDSAGIGYFGLMSAGMWGTKEAFETQEGSSPVHMCAWSKIQNGWIEPEVINTKTPLHVSLYENSSDKYNIIKIPINSSEYFLLENRNNSGYDRGLKTIDGIFRGGMALWKIDDDVIKSNISTNTVNSDKNNKGVALIEATHALLDISTYERGHEKNLFYYENRSSYSEALIEIGDISSRSEIMTAEISN